MSVTVSPEGVDEVEQEEDFLSFTLGAWAELRVALGDEVGPKLEPPTIISVADIPEMVRHIETADVDDELKGPLVALMLRLAARGVAMEVN